MVAVADSVTGVWVNAAIVVTAVGVGPAGKVGFTGKVRLAGIGCEITHLEPPLYWCLGSLLLVCLLGYWGFLSKEFLSGKNMLLLGWLPSLPLVPGRFSFFLLGMESCAPGFKGYDLDGLVSPEHGMPLIILIFTLTAMVSIGRRHLKYPCKKLHSGLIIQAIWKIIYIVIYSFHSVILI